MLCLIQGRSLLVGHLCAPLVQLVDMVAVVDCHRMAALVRVLRVNSPPLALRHAPLAK